MHSADDPRKRAFNGRHTYQSVLPFLVLCMANPASETSLGVGTAQLEDVPAFVACMAGPSIVVGDPCLPSDLDANGTVDLEDFSQFARIFTRLTGTLADNCSTAGIASGFGVLTFDNTAATTDGPPHPACVRDGQDQIANDLWLCWTAPVSCNELVVLDTCNEATQFDTKMAAYEGCTCPATTDRLVACNDDACGAQSRMVFPAQAGQQYLIRVGNFPLNPPGSGAISIACGLDACENAEGDCFHENSTPGCSTLDCCNAVCAVDSFCCDLASGGVWDAVCVAETEGFCNGGFAVCGDPASGSCTMSHASPGCGDATCCDAVCAQDPSCCVFDWNPACVELEAELCRSACVDSSEPCDQAHATPGCTDPGCCAEVCPRSPLCCQNVWDASCVQLAAEYCN